MRHAGLHRRAPWIPVGLTALALLPATLSAQTIRGRLLDAENGRPIDLGILTLFTEDGDSAGLTASHPNGFFEIAAPGPGAYLLRASAFGYVERQEGIFELPEGGRIDLEFRISPRPMELEDILVSTDRPAFDHPLVQNGFVQRYQRGLGHFITPRDLERTVYRDTEALFTFVPGVRVLTTSVSARGGSAVLGLPVDRVVMRGPTGGWCAPTVYVDGIRTQYRPGTGQTLSLIAPLGVLEAVEMYRRPSEVPPEYGATAGQICGVIVFWTKR